MAPDADDQALVEWMNAPMDRSASDISRDGQIRRRRNRFVVYPPPASSMSSKIPFPSSRYTPGEPPADLRNLARWFEGLQSGRERFRWTLRDSLDELMDGQRTGRWSYHHLTKTEKTHLGTVVEVNLTKEFTIPNGDDLDWRVSDEDVDCKVSKDIGGWEIPMEMYRCDGHGERAGKLDHPALLVWLNDSASQWAAGLFRCTDEKLRWGPNKQTGLRERKYNRDNKRRIEQALMSDIYWLWGGMQHDLPANTLLQMDSTHRDRILAEKMSGQKRVDALFTEVQNEIVRRPIVLTVAQQDDAPKRVRDARRRLRSKGIVILGHQESHPIIARLLGLPVPVKGEWISTRLIPVGGNSERPDVFFDNKYWAIAYDHEAVHEVSDIPKRLPGTASAAGLNSA